MLKSVLPLTVVAAIAASMIAAAPTMAEPGIWPDCNPSDAAAMAECAKPPPEPCGQNGIVSGFNGLNGGAWACTASGHWAWRAMDYSDWLLVRCQQMARAAGQSC